MTRIVVKTALLSSIGLSLALAFPPDAAAEGSGYFRMADNRQEYKHAVALSRESASEAGKRKVNVYLTTHPVDPAKAAGEFDMDSSITEQLRDLKGGMTRITINPDGSDGGLWFWASDPSDTFNTSGFGTLTVSVNTPTRIEGSHVLAEPEDFFDKTYQFDMKFATDVTSADFTGDALGAGGGEPGKSWLAYTVAVEKGDVNALRAHMGESGEWMLPKDDEESSKSYVDMLRYSTPVKAKVTGGWLQDGRAILKVEGKDSDGNAQRGIVLVVKDGDRWREESKDLNTIWN
jgi:hypothetical protein